MIWIERLVGSGIYALAYQLLAQKAMEAKDEIFFIGGDLAALDGRAEIVHPTEAAALTAAEQPSPLGKGPPPSLPFFLDVICQQLVLFRSPRPSLQTHLCATRRLGPSSNPSRLSRRGRRCYRRLHLSTCCLRCCCFRRRRWVPHCKTFSVLFFLRVGVDQMRIQMEILIS